VHTIKDVGDACGLPGPVIAQLVPRTWVDGVGWMFTAEQLRESVTLAGNLRQILAWSRTGVHVQYAHCGTALDDDALAALRWLLVADPAPAAWCPPCRARAPAPN
jgi:hypothetical protein